ncbi:MAG TPA: hypothetical protein VNG90_04150 [Candidatus Acidoferrum sp.]|nr:hypothetical protein [Candidatus Acidoferrum sp.]
MALEKQLEIRQFPYPTSIPERLFEDAFSSLVDDIATILEDGVRIGKYKHPNLGICIMNPARGLHILNPNAVLALVAISDGNTATRQLVENAMGVAFPCRTFCLNSSILVRARPHCLPDGILPQAGGAWVSGTSVGCGGQTSQQNEELSQIIGGKYNQMVAKLRMYYQSEDGWYGKSIEIVELAAKFRT